MLNSPFQYEPWLTPDEYQKLGELTMRWSHIDHIIGNCLTVMLNLSNEQAVVIVFSLSTEWRLQRLEKLAELEQINEDARTALDALIKVMRQIQIVRNNIIHAIMIEDDKEGAVFHRRSAKRTMTKKQVFDTEELTNYAAHAAFSLLYALRGKYHPLPDKPDVPDYLTNPPPSGIRLGRPLLPQPPPSPG